jgi:hypothetical protein
MGLISGTLAAEFKLLSESCILDGCTLRLVFELNRDCDVFPPNSDIDFLSWKRLSIHPNPFLVVHPTEFSPKRELKVTFRVEMELICFNAQSTSTIHQ